MTDILDNIATFSAREDPSALSITASVPVTYFVVYRSQTLKGRTRSRRLAKYLSLWHRFHNRTPETRKYSSLERKAISGRSD